MVGSGFLLPTSLLQNVNKLLRTYLTLFLKITIIIFWPKKISSNTLVQESGNRKTTQPTATQPTAFHAKDFARKIFGVKAVV